MFLHTITISKWTVSQKDWKQHGTTTTHSIGFPHLLWYLHRIAVPSATMLPLIRWQTFNVPELSQLMYRMASVHGACVQTQAIWTDYFFYRSFHQMRFPDLLTPSDDFLIWDGAIPTKRLFWPFWKGFLEKTRVFWGKPEVFIKQVGKAEVSAHVLQIRRIKVP